VQELREATAIDAAREKELAKKNEQEVSDKMESEVLQHLRGSNPAVTAKDIVGNDLLTPEAKGRMLNIVERETKADPPAKTSRQTSVGLLDRLQRADDDPARLADLKPVYDAYIGGKLSRSDFDLVRKQPEFPLPRG